MKRDFTTNGLYHIYNQGVEDRKIFLDKNDYFRFLYALCEFNSDKPAREFERILHKNKDKIDKIVGSQTSFGGQGGERREKVLRRGKEGRWFGDRDFLKRNKLVDIYCYSLMPNHYHVVLQELVDGGVTRFMRKLNGGYTKAFNLKYKRAGYLFQGSYKIKEIKNDAELIFLICYLHVKSFKKINDFSNPSLTELQIKKILRFIKNYNWSSHKEYLGENKFFPIIGREFIFDFFDGVNSYEEFITDWLKDYKQNIEYVYNILAGDVD